MGKKNKYRKKVDWVPIEQEFATGQLTRLEIAKRFDVSRAAINKHMTRVGIEYGSLASEVRRKIQTKLVEEPEVTHQVTHQVTPMKPEEAVERAATRGAEVIRLHRKKIQQQFELNESSEQFLAEIAEDLASKKIGTESIPTVKSFVIIHDKVVQITERLIKLQRQAYSLDETLQDSGKARDLDNIPPELAELFK